MRRAPGRSTVRAWPRALLLVLATPALAAAAGLVNGDLRAGSDNQPTGWYQVFWSPTASVFSWTPPSGDAGGVLRITSTEGNDAKWCQTVAVEPDTTYRVAAQARALNVGTELYGAIITVEPRVGDSEDLRGTTTWRLLEVTLDSGELTRWEICLRLGNYANLNTGTAEFRDVSLTPLGAPRAARWRVPLPRLALPAAWSETLGPAVPLLGGLLLAFGLGIFRRRRRDDGAR